MSIRHTLRNHLLTFADLTERIGARVYADMAPAGADTPYVILSVVSGEPANHLGGESGTTRSIVQVSVWSRDALGGVSAAFEVDTVAELIRDKISGDRGYWDAANTNVFVSDCVLEGEPSTQANEAEDGSDLNWHGVFSDYSIMHSRPVPTRS